MSKRSFITLYVYEHFKLDMCTYGGKGANNTSVTDVFWKDGCKVPEILVSEVIKLVEKGIMSSNHEATRNSIFEASVILTQVPKGSSMDDLKKLLRSFQNEFYPERKLSTHSILLHFYSQMRAKDAITFMHNTPHTFPNVELVCHRKEIGTAGTVD